MKNYIKILIPITTILIPFSVVSCNKNGNDSVTLSWSSQQGPYTYQSEKHKEVTLSQEAATDEYFNTVSNFTFVEDALQHCINRSASHTNWAMTITLNKLDRTNHTVTGSFDQNYIDEEQLFFSLKSSWTNVPIELVYDAPMFENQWCIIPKGLHGCEITLPEVLKQNHEWSFHAEMEHGTEHKIITVDWQTTEETSITKFTSCYFASTYFENVKMG